MVGVMQTDERPTRLAPVAPVLDGHLHRHFDGGRSIVGKEDTRESWRQHLHEPFSQFDRGTMCAAGKDDVLEVCRLSRQRRIEPRMRVTVDVHPPGRRAV